MCVVCEVAQSCPTLCDPMDCSLLGSSIHGIFQANNTGVGCHFLLQRIFPTQGSNPGLPHCRQTLYHLSHQGSPWQQCDLRLKDLCQNVPLILRQTDLNPHLRRRQTLTGKTGSVSCGVTAPVSWVLVCTSFSLWLL